MAIFKLPSSEDTFEKIIKTCHFSGEDDYGKTSALLYKNNVNTNQNKKDVQKSNSKKKNYELSKEIVIKENLKRKTHQTTIELSDQSISQITYSEFIKGITKTSTEQSECDYEKLISSGNQQKKMSDLISKELIDNSSNSCLIGNNKFDNRCKFFNKLFKKGCDEIKIDQNFKKGTKCISLLPCSNEKKFKCVNFKNYNVKSRFENVKNCNFGKRKTFNDLRLTGATSDEVTHNESSGNAFKKKGKKLNCMKKNCHFDVQNTSKFIYQGKKNLDTTDKKISLKEKLLSNELNVSKTASNFNAVCKCNDVSKLKCMNNKDSVSEKVISLLSGDASSRKKSFQVDCKKNFQNQFQEVEFSMNCDDINATESKLNSYGRSKIKGVQEDNKDSVHNCSETDVSTENYTVRTMNNLLQPGNRSVKTPVIFDSGTVDNFAIDIMYRALQTGCVKSYGFIRDIIPSLKSDLKEDAVQFSCQNCVKTFSFCDVRNTFCAKELSSLCPANCLRQQKVPAEFCFKFIVRDLAGIFFTYVLIGKEAENFFGCTISDFWHSNNTRRSVRRAIRNLMRSYNRKILNEFCLSTKNLFGSGPKYLVSVCKKYCVAPSTRKNF